VSCVCVRRLGVGPASIDSLLLNSVGREAVGGPSGVDTLLLNSLGREAVRGPGSVTALLLNSFGCEAVAGPLVQPFGRNTLRRSVSSPSSGQFDRRLFRPDLPRKTTSAK
jgi:hypothetical protein